MNKKTIILIIIVCIAIYFFLPKSPLTIGLVSNCQYGIDYNTCYTVVGYPISDFNLKFHDTDPLGAHRSWTYPIILDHFRKLTGFRDVKDCGKCIGTDLIMTLNKDSAAEKEAIRLGFAKQDQQYDTCSKNLNLKCLVSNRWCCDWNDGFNSPVCKNTATNLYYRAGECISQSAMPSSQNFFGTYFWRYSPIEVAYPCSPPYYTSCNIYRASPESVYKQLYTSSDCIYTIQQGTHQYQLLGNITTLDPLTCEVTEAAWPAALKQRVEQNRAQDRHKSYGEVKSIVFDFKNKLSIAVVPDTYATHRAETNITNRTEMTITEQIINIPKLIEEKIPLWRWFIKWLRTWF